MSFYPKTSPSLLDINKTAATSLTIFNPLNAQLDLALWGSVGLGTLQQELEAQLKASLQAGLDLGLHLANPYLGFQMALAGVAQLIAQIQAALSGAFPLPDLGAIQANAALTASLGVRVGALKAVLGGMLSVKLPAVRFIQDLALNMNVGPLKMVAWENENAVSVAQRIQTEIENEYGSDPTYGVLLVTRGVDVWNGIKYSFQIG